MTFNQFIAQIILTIWQAKNKAINFGIFQITSTILNFTLTIIFILFFNKNWTVRIESQLITSVLFALIAIFILFKNRLLKFQFNLDYFISGLKFGVPLIPHVIGGIFLSIVNRFFIVKYVGLNEAGLFFLAFQLTSIINIFTNALNTAYVPWLFSKLENINDNQKRKIVVLTYKYFIFLTITSVVFTFLLPTLLHLLVGKDYYSSQKYFNWLVIGCVANGMYLMVTNYIVYAKKTHYLAFSTFTSSLICIGLNYLFIIKYGALGAAIASALGFIILFLSTWILSTIAFKMPWFNFKNT